MKTILNRTMIAAAVAGCAGSMASADVVRDLGGGWQVVIADAIADQIDIVSDGVVTINGVRTLIIEKFAEFRSYDPQTGLFGGLQVQFRQTASDANTATRIIITDEGLYNNTGAAWFGFRMQLIDQRARSASTPSRRSTATSPTARSPSMVFSAGNTQVDFAGGPRRAQRQQLVPRSAVGRPGDRRQPREPEPGCVHAQGNPDPDARRCRAAWAGCDGGHAPPPLS